MYVTKIKTLHTLVLLIHIPPASYKITQTLHIMLVSIRRWWKRGVSFMWITTHKSRHFVLPFRLNAESTLSGRRHSPSRAVWCEGCGQRDKLIGWGLGVGIGLWDVGAGVCGSVLTGSWLHATVLGDQEQGPLILVKTGARHG